MERVIIKINLILLVGALAFAAAFQQELRTVDTLPAAIEVTGAQG